MSTICRALDRRMSAISASSNTPVYLTAVDDGRLLVHVGFEVRTIAVGTADLTVGGVGGVLVAPGARGSGLGRRPILESRDAMRSRGVEFGNLGCRPSVVAFYESAGWFRIGARERHLSRHDGVTVTDHNGPLLVCTVRRSIDRWPDGDTDLRGRPW